MINWITEKLGTSSWDRVTLSDDIHIIDVRDLVDKAGNTPIAIKTKIDEALTWLQRGKTVVVCCDYGISRSNAIAVGILVISEGISFDDALRRVLAATYQKQIRLETLNSIRRAVESYRSESATFPKQSGLKILLTGSSGNLGRPLTRTLSNNFAIETPGRAEIDLLEGPIDLDFMIREKCITHILHVANPRDFGKNQALSLGQSLVMLKNILDVCKENCIKLIFVSSWEVYSGYRSDRLLADESLPAYPKGSVGETKFLCETILEHYRSFYGVDYANLRAPIIYGTEDTRPKFIFNFIQKATRSDKIFVHKFLNGYPLLDMLNISDFCRAVQMVLESNASGTFNIGSGKAHASRDIAEMICEILGQKGIIDFNKVDDYFSNIVMDFKKISALGWAPKIDLHSGLETLLAIYRGKEA
jgi:nucleoside-diphosphate-sugar epimerase